MPVNETDLTVSVISFILIRLDRYDNSYQTLSYLVRGHPLYSGYVKFYKTGIASFF